MYTRENQYLFDLLKKHRSILNMSGLTKKAQLPANYLNKQFAGQGSKWWTTANRDSLKSLLNTLADDIKKLK